MPKVPAISSFSVCFFSNYIFFLIPFSKWKLSRGVKVKKLWLFPPFCSCSRSVVDVCCPSVVLSDHVPHSLHYWAATAEETGKDMLLSSATHPLPPHPALVSVCLLLFLVSHKINFFCSCHSLETLLLLSLSRRGKRQREKRGQ